MAKSPSPASALDQVRSLLTAAEKKVLDSSTGSAIAKATREQVEASIVHARTFRDKWRDLHAAQTRSTKRSAAAGSGANQRSREKHEVFADAVKRLEARLAELAGGAGKAAGRQAGRFGSAKQPAKTPKPVRTLANRAKRASVRGSLKAAVAKINREPRPKAAKAAAVTKPAKGKAAASAKARRVGRSR